MIYLLMSFLLLSCNQNSMDKNIDTFGFSDNNLREQIYPRPVPRQAEIREEQKI